MQARHAPLLARLLPPVSYDPNAPRLAADLSAEGARLDEALAASVRLSQAIVPGPDMPPEYLVDWERLLDLHPAAGATEAERLAAVMAKLLETGGLSRDYFTQLATGFGLVITIDEMEPFRAGTSRVGEGLWIPGIIWVWRVNVSAPGPLPALEAMFNDLKPAETAVTFEYLP